MRIGLRLTFPPLEPVGAAKPDRYARAAPVRHPCANPCAKGMRRTRTPPSVRHSRPLAKNRLCS